MATRATSSVSDKPVHDRVKQPAQIGLRTQAAAELDQRLAIVIALVVEDAVDPS